MTTPPRHSRQNVHMKKVYVLLAGALMIVAPEVRSADALTEALQKGLFEEEANQNLDAAIKAYQDVLGRADEQRRVAATALFRLAECYRKQGKTNEASAEYRRLVRDYADQSTLVNLSRQNLTGLGAAPGAAVATADTTAVGSTDEEEKEIRRIKALIKDSPDLINARNQEIYRTGSDNPRVTYGTVLHQAAYKGHLQVASYLLGNGSDPNARSSEEQTPLFYAAQNGHRNMAELLLTKGADPNVGPPASYRGTPLHAASSKGFRAVAEVLLAHKAEVNALDGSGKTPLHAAVEAGFLPVAELLIGRGADVNAHYALPWNSQGGSSQLTRIELYDGTPLHFAVQKGNVEMTRFLLSKGANVEARSGAGLAPLHYSAHNTTDAKAAIAAMLLQNKADANAKGSSDSRFSGWTPLYMAVFQRATNLVALFLEKGADPNLTMDNAKMEYRTALHNAVEYGDLSTAARLLKHKADVNAPDFQNITPLLRATRKNDAAMVDLLLANDADIKATDSDGNTPLVLAVKNDSVRVAERLLAKGADSNARTSDGSSLLSIVMGSRSPNQPFAPRPIPPRSLTDVPGKTQPASAKTILEVLLDHKADVNAPLGDETSNTPLQQAVAVNATNWVRWLLEKGANPNVPWSRPDVESRTVLHAAVDKQLFLVADLLLRHGADVNGLDTGGLTPIFRAINGNNTNMVDLLLRHNADLTAARNDGGTPLFRAVEIGNTAIAEQLLAKGANPNVTDNEGYAPLHVALGAKEQTGGGIQLGGIIGVPTYAPPGIAVPAGNVTIPSRTIINPAQPSARRLAPSKTRSMVEVLLEHKADPNLRDKRGNTPLALAVQKGNDEATQLLLKRKADPHQTSLSGFAPLHYAAMFGNSSGAEMLLAHKANPNAKNQDAETPVHFAANRAFTNVLVLLLDKGGDINACATEGDTPLHKALKGSGNMNPTLQILLDRGADVTKSCGGKQSPFDFARVRHAGQAEWFRKYHPKKLARVDLNGPVEEGVWYWEANQKQTLSQVIAAVGLREKANPRNIRILRDDPETRLKEELHFDLMAIREKRSPDVPLQDKDKIIVAER
jgi:ankyrin repeat protein